MTTMKRRLGTPASAAAPAAVITATPQGMSEMAAPQMSPPPAQVPVAVQPKTAAVMSDGSAVDAAKAQAIAQQLVLTDAQAVLNFGTQAQNQIASFADKMLEETKVKDMDVVRDQLGSVMKHVRSINMSGDFSKGNFMSGLPIVGRFFDKVQQFRDDFDSVKNKVDTVASELNTSRGKLLTRVDVLNQFAEANRQQYDELVLMIEAGHIALANAKTVDLPRLTAQAQATQDPVDIDALNDFTAAVERFEKKISDLEITRMSCIQTAPQIRIIIAGNVTLAENIDSTVHNAIPIWKKQFVMLSALEEQKKAADLNDSVRDMTNDMLKKTADMTHSGAVQIAKANQRSVIDMDTLKHVNDKLIATIDDVARIADEGKRARDAARPQLEQMEKTIREKILTRATTTAGTGSNGPR